MRYTEFENDICNFGDDYRVAQNDDYVYVIYKDNEILEVSTRREFSLSLVRVQGFNNCPKKPMVWNEASLLAATPLDEREEEKKYNVIVGDDESESPYVVWGKNNAEEYFLYVADSNGLREYPDFQFTDSEFKDLIKYIKTLPDGEFQAKVAEHGKRLVKEGKDDDL